MTEIFQRCSQRGWRRRRNSTSFFAFVHQSRSRFGHVTFACDHGTIDSGCGAVGCHGGAGREWSSIHRIVRMRPIPCTFASPARPSHTILGAARRQHAAFGRGVGRAGSCGPARGTRRVGVSRPGLARGWCGAASEHEFCFEVVACVVCDMARYYFMKCLACVTLRQTFCV